ncbi:uncharacterized mitochondrial protein AtMg00810-like [Hibiscus syriacus]|uniref:uncharacterized mitochondrial protein AtMg00810-like n=1 Tax=Hibiscus syriacus TaxID=106335 RepID=UPI00192370A1|nr:uncharacterized mitochondrial protein AtMg00810-like [Hibiscus syriacus]
MMQTFEMTDLGLLHYFLEIEIKEKMVFISQRKYVADLLKRFNMLSCKMAATPMDINEKLQLEDGTEKIDAKAFRSLIGGLIYLSHTFCDNRSSIYQNMKVGILKPSSFSTRDYGICLGSGAITWSSKKQVVIALSSSEAEYVAATSSACQVI